MWISIGFHLIWHENYISCRYQQATHRTRFFERTVDWHTHTYTHRDVCLYFCRVKIKLTVGINAKRNKKRKHLCQWANNAHFNSNNNLFLFSIFLQRLPTDVIGKRTRTSQITYLRSVCMGRTICYHDHCIDTRKYAERWFLATEFRQNQVWIRR